MTPNPNSCPDPAPCPPDAVRRVACIGAGVIGGGWAAHFLARGYDVTAWDPAPDAEAKLRGLIDAAWPALEQLGLADSASRERLSVLPTLEEAVADAEFVQESAPEELELKRLLLARLDAATPAGVVIASSTSGYPMTDMQRREDGVDGKEGGAGTAGAGSRLLVGHPFNPPYLIPLVEVAGGELTDPAAVVWASRFYEAAGKSVITLDREVPGFIANRLQEALWREALHMVANGEATVRDIDAAITEGPGLRWAFRGPCLTFALAGGDGGMARMLDHFGPSLKSPWTRLDAPELDASLRTAMVEGCDEAAGDRSLAQLAAERDQGVIDVLRATGRLPGQTTGDAAAPEEGDTK
jgi:carnitine 3-dehydrogenase